MNLIQSKAGDMEVQGLCAFNWTKRKEQILRAKRVMNNSKQKKVLSICLLK